MRNALPRREKTYYDGVNASNAIPSRTRIKICGISTPQTAQAAVDAGADAIGLVFVDASPRCMSLETARAIVQALPPMVEPIGLFCDASLGYVIDTAKAVGLRTVQLHGSETHDDAAALHPLRVIKALPFDPPTAPAVLPDQLADWLAPPPNVAALLLDTPKQSDSTLTGGSGHAFDWEALAGVPRHNLPPLILAGGLTPGNVREAIETVKPYAVDVSSGVEAERGVKDIEKINDFCAAVQRVDANATR